MFRELLIRLYPSEWRHRYGDEMLDILDAAPLTPFVLVDTLRGAADAHLDRCLSPIHERQRRRRRLSPLVVIAVALTLAAYPYVLRGPRRRLILLPAYSA